MDNTNQWSIAVSPVAADSKRALGVSLLALLTAGVPACASGGSEAGVAGSAASSGAPVSGGSSSGGNATSGGTGGTGHTGGTGGTSTGGASTTGGTGGSSSGGASTTGGTGGTQTTGGAGGYPVSQGCGSPTSWADVSTAQITKLGGSSAQSYPGGCSGTVTNRVTGDVMVHIVGFGIWRSSDKGSSWSRIDNNVLDAGGGRCENGWGIQVDQDNPSRMAVFTLDGSAGYTVDGTTWKQWTHAPWNRNWDYGSVDWSSPTAKTIIGVEHEKPSQVVALSTDGGSSWKELTTFDTAGGSAAMVGVIDSNTLIGSRGGGIVRSTDLGVTWNKVSSENPLTHVPVRFNGKFYLTTSTGLLVTADGGVTWTHQGVAIAGQTMLQGPYFGADANTLAVGTNSTPNYNTGTSSIYKSIDGGAHWTKIGDAPPTSSQYPFNYVWFGGFSWDPIHDVYYSTAMSNPAYRKECGG